MSMWDTFTGSAAYREIFIRGLKVPFLVRLAWHTLAATMATITLPLVILLAIALFAQTRARDTDNPVATHHRLISCAPITPLAGYRSAPAFVVPQLCTSLPPSLDRWQSSRTTRTYRV